MKGCYQVFGRVRFSLAIAALSLALTACGGGGSGALEEQVSDTTGTTTTTTTTTDTGTTNDTGVSGQQVGSASLSWRPPAERVDGESLALTEIAGYRIYYGTRSGQYDSAVAIDDPYASSVVLEDLPVGEYYFVMTTVDTNGLESGYSSEAVKSVSAA